MVRTHAHPLVVTVDESAVGVGKTYNAIRAAVLEPCRYLFVVERRASIREIEQRVRAVAPPSVAIVTIMSDDNLRGFSVRQEVEALPTRYMDGHLIAICTHQAMMMADLSAFSGWRVVIDEAPNVLTQQQIQSKCDVAFFEANYVLTPLFGDWSAVSLTEAGAKLDGGDLQHDDSHRYLRLFHQRVTASASGRSPAVVCNLPSWSAMANDNVVWTWWSLFSLEQLAAFASVTVLANGFMGSVTAKLLEAISGNIEWMPRSSLGHRPLTRREVAIRFFSEQPSSIRFFQTDEGQKHLAEIGSYIGERVSVDRFIWSANSCARKAMNLPDQCYLSPRQAGTDRYMHCTQAAMIYAAKPNQEVRSILRALDVDPHFWTSSAEYEAILQFVTRTSIRDVSSSAMGTIFVYSRDQAKYLQAFFDRQPHVTSQMEFVDLGLKRPTKKVGRPKDEPLSLVEAQRKSEDRKRRRADQQRLRRASKRAA